MADPVLPSISGVSSGILSLIDSGVANSDGVGHISWAASNSAAFARIVDLYSRPGAEIADVTFGKGTFWKDVDQSRYELRATDLAVDRIDATALPYADLSLDMVVFDPPYRYVETRTVASHVDEQYRLSETLRAARPGLDGVLDLYREGIAEGVRVLRHGGVLVVKCQDTVADGKQHWIHRSVMDWADAAGCPAIDLAIVVSSSPPPTRWKIQRTLKKAHSYFVVCRKGGAYPFGYKSVQARAS